MMTEPVFLDANFLIATLNVDDQWHGIAEQMRPTLNSADPIVTTKPVLYEVADAMAHPLRNQAGQAVASLCSDSRITVDPVADETFASALALYQDRPDKDWSLTDCVSFIVMRKMEIQRAMTADHHFEQAGFVAMMRTQRKHNGADE
jgi:hypothetical protein